METRNALATVRLRTQQSGATNSFHIKLTVWSRSFDHPNPSHRNALVTGVYLTQLAGTPGYFSNTQIKDRYGVDHTRLWAGADSGFKGYTEYDPGAGPPWGANTGIYDERCLTDPSCDLMRLQTYRTDPHKLLAFNYLIGPVTFDFDVELSAPPKAVKLVLGHIGGNGGNPAQRYALLPDEEFIVQLA
jgi:hypothetical protein